MVKYNAIDVENISVKTPVLAIDWGNKRLGLALSDPTRTLARPLCVLEHVSRPKDAMNILLKADENNVGLIIIGINYDEYNVPTISGRSAMRLLNEIKQNTILPIIPWNETGSTKSAISSRIDIGVKKEKRKGHHDSIAAAFILQNFLDSDENC